MPLHIPHPALRSPSVKAQSPAPSARGGRLRVFADKDHILTHEEREAASLEAGMRASRRAGIPVEPATRKRYRRAAGKRDLLLAESHAYLLGMVSEPTRQAAVSATRHIKSSGAPP